MKHPKEPAIGDLVLREDFSTKILGYIKCRSTFDKGRWMVEWADEYICSYSETGIWALKRSLAREMADDSKTR